MVHFLFIEFEASKNMERDILFNILFGLQLRN